MKVIAINGRVGGANGHLCKRKVGAWEISVKDAAVTVYCLICRREL
jgi:hypothetical protein